MTAAKGQIRAHTGLRGIAALLVVAYHQEFGPFYKLPIELSTNVFRHSYLMVDLFFVLSGFIISYVYKADRKLPFSKNETIAFLFTRFARIYPLHALTMFYMLFFAIASTTTLALLGHATSSITAKSFSDWGLQLALVQSWIPGYEAWNIPSWSISAEMFAYLLFPLIVFFCVLAPRLAKIMLLLSSLAFYIYVGATGGSLDIISGLAPLRCLAGFMLGMTIYYGRLFVAAVSETIHSIIQVVAILWISVVLAMKGGDPFIIPAFALIVAFTWQDRGLVARALSRIQLQWLGEISYSVYLLHGPIGGTLWFFWVPLEKRLGLAPPVTRAMWLVLIFAAVLICSHLSHRYIEVPARQRLTRWRGRKAPPSDVLAAAP